MPLHKAAERALVKMAQLLLRFGADVNVRSECYEVSDLRRKYIAKYGKYTPLHNAAVHNQVEMVQLLIDNGASVDARDIKNDTPLHWAIEYWTSKMAILRLSVD